MDPSAIYAKTSSGEEAVQHGQGLRRDLRVVLVQVDGKATVAELSAKVGEVRRVESALRRLERGGFISLVQETSSRTEAEAEWTARAGQAASVSVFSTFGPKSLEQWGTVPSGRVMSSIFSTFEGLPEPSPERLELPEPSFDTERPASGFRWSWIVWGLSLTLLLGAGGAVLFYPYERYQDDLEGTLGRVFSAPVKISGITFNLLPKPGLYLRDIHVGEGEESRIDEVRIASPLPLLGFGKKDLGRVEMEGVRLSADRIAAMGKGARPGEGFLIRHAALRRVTVMARDMTLGALEGELLFSHEGELDLLSLYSGDRALRIDALPHSAGMALSIDMPAWRPVTGKPFVFGPMHSQASLQKEKLVFQGASATFMGGLLNGAWSLEWSQGLKLWGDASLLRVDAREFSQGFGLSPNLDGSWAGKLRWKAAGDDWAGLWNALKFSLDGEITQGVLHGIDLGEALQRSPGQSIQHGTTRFDSLRGRFQFSEGKASGEAIELSAGLLKAVGQFALSDGLLNGRLEVTMTRAASSASASLRLDGQLPAMTGTVEQKTEKKTTP